MPLLDGKYEIHEEHPLGGGVTAFRATAPDGAPVRVEWIELGPEDEAAFERYRRLLKRLARDGRASLRDVVARPGARYVAWSVPDEAGARAHDPAVDAVVREAGFDPADADCRRVDGVVRLVALPFRAPVAAPLVVAGDRAAGRERRPGPSPALQGWILSATLCALSLGFVMAGFQRRANDRVVVIPDVVGIPYEAAAAELADLGLSVSPQPVAADSERPGTVLGVEPTVGQTLRPGRTVHVSVALPAGQLAPTRVPRLTGLPTIDAAGVALDRADLVLGRVIRVHLDAPAGVLLAQSPLPDVRVGRGTAIDVVASLGPRPTRTFLPDLVGMPLADARALAVVAGLDADQVVVEGWPTPREPPGTVLAQSLAPYRDVVATEATLRLIVSEAPEERDPMSLPPLAGMSEAEARALARGFTVEAAYASESGLPDGVVAQSLAPGAQPADGTLLLTVNARPVPIPLPAIEVIVRAPSLRELRYLWFIEPGIPLVTAEVTATTLEGDTFLVARTDARGGGRVAGDWWTTYPGVVRFDLTLNGEPYGGTLRVP